MGEATSSWGIRACLRQGGLSRNKVSVGEPADGSPPTNLGNGGRGDFSPRLPNLSTLLEIYYIIIIYILLFNNHLNIEPPKQSFWPNYAEDIYILYVDHRNMRRILATMMMLLMTTAALAGCAGSDVTDEDVDAAREEGRLAGIAEATPVSTLDTIHERGTMKCGVKDSQWGMGFADADGVRSGLDIEYCKAVAAAIGLDAEQDIEYILASAGDRFEKLASGEIDVLIRTTTWTTSRDADLNADFAGMNFFDGQGILIRGDAFPQANTTSALNLASAKVCVGTGTTTEGNLADYNTVNSIGMDIVPVADAAEATTKLVDGSCDAFTGDMSAMVAKKYTLELTDAEGNSGCPGCDLVDCTRTSFKRTIGSSSSRYGF